MMILSQNDNCSLQDLSYMHAVQRETLKMILISHTMGNFLRERERESNIENICFKQTITTFLVAGVLQLPKLWETMCWPRLISLTQRLGCGCLRRQWRDESLQRSSTMIMWMSNTCQESSSPKMWSVSQNVWHIQHVVRVEGTYNFYF